MKRTLFIYLAILLLLMINKLFAQTLAPKLVELYNPYHFVSIIRLNNGKIIITENLILSVQGIDSLKIISRMECLNTFSIFASAEAMVIKPKPNIRFTTLSQLVEKYSLQKMIFAKVYVDEMYIENPETILAEDNNIDGVKTAIDPSTKENLLYILTKEHNYSRKKSTASFHINYLQPQELLMLYNYMYK